MATEQDVHDLNRLAAHLEGRLTEHESASLVEHLAACEPCRSALASFARASAAAAPARRRVSAAWLPIAATLALATTAAVLALRLGPRAVAPPAPPPLPRSSSPVRAPSSTAAPLPVAPPPAARGGTPEPTRAGTRTVGGKTFRLEAGVWIDAGYDPLALLPVSDAVTRDARAALLARIPALAPYAALGVNVIVVHGGTVYRLGPLSAARQ